MEAQSGEGLAFPVFVLLYADEADFRSWHSDVFPHEIAHLFFYQALRGGMST